jgi:hypothetical protein
LKDQELILRFLALFKLADEYQRPMTEFLNLFTIWGRKQDVDTRENFERVFKETIDVVMESIGSRAFRPERAFNAAAFDSIMVGIARRLQVSKEVDLAQLNARYDELLADKTYLNLIAQATANEENVSARLKVATEKFANL